MTFTPGALNTCVPVVAGCSVMIPAPTMKKRMKATAVRMATSTVRPTVLWAVRPASAEQDQEEAGKAAMSGKELAKLATMVTTAADIASLLQGMCTHYSPHVQIYALLYTDRAQENRVCNISG